MLNLLNFLESSLAASELTFGTVTAIDGPLTIQKKHCV